MNSLSIKEFEESIIDFTNKAPFPMEVKRLVFLDILNKLEAATNEEVNFLIQQREAMKNTEEKESRKNEHGIHANNMEERGNADQ